MLHSPPSSSAIPPPHPGNLISKDSIGVYDLWPSRILIHPRSQREFWDETALNIFPSRTCPGGLSDQR
nr:hypothetical protein Itr_chr08CG09330 [Ipomoea trifida]